MYSRRRSMTVRGEQQPSLLCIGRPLCLRDKMEMPMPSAMHRFERCRVIHDGDDIQFIKRQTVILEETTVFPVLVPELSSRSRNGSRRSAVSGSGWP